MPDAHTNKCDGDVFTEAAAVCLKDRGHSDPMQLHLKTIDVPQYLLPRPYISEAMRRTHNDMKRATKHGACCDAIMFLRKLTSSTVVRQPRREQVLSTGLGHNWTRKLCRFRVRLALTFLAFYTEQLLRL